MYFEEESILTNESLQEYMQKQDKKILFTRNIAFRIYLFTGNTDAVFNWFAAEHLIANIEWQTEMLRMANVYRYFRLNDINSPLLVRSERIQRELSKY